MNVKELMRYREKRGLPRITNVRVKMPRAITHNDKGRGMSYDSYYRNYILPFTSRYLLD